MRRNTPVTEALRGIRNFNRNLDKIVIDEAAKDKDRITELNREQLLEGQDTQGNNLTPSYLNDPYFKTREAAKRYSDWKDKITPNTKRPAGTPNLYIDGSFHRSIGYKKRANAIEGKSTSEIAPEVNAKYRNLVIGLSPENMAYFIQKFFRPRFTNRLRSALGIS